MQRWQEIHQIAKQKKDMNRKPYQNVNVLEYLQKKYAIPEEKKNE